MRNSFGPSGVDRNVSIPARDTAPVASCHQRDPPSFGGGWVHAHNNAERCPAPHRALAAPPSLEDLNRKVLADRARRRAAARR